MQHDGPMTVDRCSISAATNLLVVKTYYVEHIILIFREITHHMRYTAVLFVRVCIAPHTTENPPAFFCLVLELVKKSPKEFSAAVMQASQCNGP